MKKIGIILILSLLFLTGCSVDNLKKDINAKITTVQEDINSYVFYGDTQFVPVSYQRIEDGTRNGLDLIQYVDLKEGTIYLYTEKFCSGYGISLTMLLDSEGKPVLYDDLESLRKEYNWTEKESFDEN